MSIVAHVPQITELVGWLEESIQAIPGRVSEQSLLSTLSGWDSMAKVMLLGLIHEKCGVDLSADELRRCRTPLAITEAIRARLRE